jgi:FdhD protein
MSEHEPDQLPKATRVIEATRVEAGATARVSEPVAEEVPVALVYNGLSHAVMMATPLGLADFALGFSLTEGILASESELYDTEIAAGGGGIEVRLTIAAERFASLRHRQRTLAGRTGCGLCGVDSISEALRPVQRVTSTARFAPEAISRAMAAFPARQMLNAEIGAVHAAGFASANGDLLLVREDVGRHNALDKLVGAMALGKLDAGSGFVVVTSRCSYEMVHKTAAAGVPLIAAVSAPTALAIDWANVAGIALAAFARDGRFTLYAGDHRIIV